MENVTKTSDLVSVVRCKDCIHWAKDIPYNRMPHESDEIERHYCSENEGMLPSDFYCADGERKDEQS